MLHVSAATTTPDEQGEPSVSRRSDRSESQLLLGPRHGAEDGAGRRTYEAYAELDPVGPLQPPRRRFIDYPRQRRRGWTRWIPSWRLVLSLGLFGVAAVCVAVLTMYSRTALPSAQNVDATFQTTIVYGSDGKTEIGRFSAQNRIWLPLDKIPDRVEDAVIAAEDRSFRTNTGVSFTAVVRAAVNNVRGGARQGGSTITQQYVKNAYSSTTDRSVGRKLDEFFVSIKTAQTLTKDEILEGYLNIIYFGRGCYGIQAAANCYFGHGVEKLTHTEAAYLAGIINGPELYDSGTASAKALAKARWNYVLDGMVLSGALTAEQRAAIGPNPPKVLPRTRAAKQAAGTQTEYLLGMVRQEAKRYGITEQDLQRGGYRIKTTFDVTKVRMAERSVTEVLGPRKRWPKGTQIAVATVDASNGQIVSVYAGDGSRDNNGVTQDIAQAGSTFKPFTLIAALEGKREPGDCTPKPPGPDSMSLRSRVDGRSPQTFKDLPKPVNNVESDGNYRDIDLVRATAESVNTAYVRLNEMVGPAHTRDVAVCAGLPAPSKDGRSGTRGLNAGLNNVLGTSSPHPIDMARAYATIASGGIYHDTYAITKITKDGTDVVPERETAGKRVFDEGVIADATFAMQAVVKQGSGKRVQAVGRPVAGKTGTAEENKAAWFAGFTPRYATIVVMQKLDRKGNPVTLVPFAGVNGQVYGGTLPARVWTDYMKAFLDGTEVQQFPEPAYGGKTVNPSPSPTMTPTPSPSAPTASPSPSASTPAPTESPTPSPSASSPDPTPSPTDPSPTPSATLPLPTVSPPGSPRPSPRR
jgi:membrane peptidoglycan carboxypeptidase